jgi:hypothetical protein
MRLAGLPDQAFFCPESTGFQQHLRNPQAKRWPGGRNK